MAASRRKILWKPRSDSDGNLVILFPYKAGNVVIRDKNGNIIARGRSTGPSNGYQDTVRFPLSGSRFRDVKVEDDTGRSFRIGDGGLRYENIGSGEGVSDRRQLKATSGEATDTSSDTGPSTGGDPSTGGQQVGPAEQNVPEGEEDTTEDVPGGDLPPEPNLIDPSIVFTPDPISFPVIPPANFNFTDPLDTAERVGEFNREQSERNFVTAVERSRELSRQELEAVQEFASQMSDFQLELLDVENAFNRQERLEAAETAIPGVQELFARQRQRAEALSEGRLLETAEDRALELTARSAAAEGNVIRGFGDESLAGRSTSDLLSAQQRLQVSQIGESFLNRSIQLASGLLFDQPTKANIAQRLPSQPAVPVTQLAPALQAQENQLTTITPTAAQQSITQQEEFQTTIEQRTNEFNATGQFEAAQFNSNQEFQAILQRAGIEIANVQAQNEQQRSAFNVEEGRRERAELQAAFDRAIDTFTRNRDRDQLLNSLGILFGGIINMPDEFREALFELTGIDLRRKKKKESSGAGTGDTDTGGREDEGTTEGAPPPRGGEDVRPPQVDREDTEPVGEAPTEPELGDDGYPEHPEGTLPEDQEELEPTGLSFSEKNFRSTLRTMGFKKRRIRQILKGIDQSVSFNSGATLNFNIREDDELVGVI